MSALSPIELLALAKLSNDSRVGGSRDNVGAGSHFVDFTVRIRGQISIQADTDKAATSQLLNLGTVALILQHAGVTREAAMDSLAKVFEIIGNDKDAAKRALTERPEVKAIHDRVKNELVAGMARTPVKGAVKLNSVLLERVDGHDAVVVTKESPAPVFEINEVDEAIMMINAK